MNVETLNCVGERERERERESANRVSTSDEKKKITMHVLIMLLECL